MTVRTLPAVACPNLASASPKDPRERTAIVDALRGWALLSVALVNYSLFYSFDAVIRIPATDETSRLLKLLVQVFFQTKGWMMLSVLFGYGFSMLMSRSYRSGPQALHLFLRRMFWLAMVALLNSAMYYGDILKDYVLMGLLIAVFYRASKKTFLVLALSGFLVFPFLIPLSRSLHTHSVFAEPSLGLYQSHNIVCVLWFGLLEGVHVLGSVPKYFDWNLVMLTCGFLGAYLQKAAFFERLDTGSRMIWKIALVSGAFAIALVAVHLALAKMHLAIEHHYDAFAWFELSLMIFLSSLVSWGFLKLRSTIFFRSFQSVGRMTLTNYLAQNVIAMLIFSGFGLGLLHKVSYADCTIMGLTVFGTQSWFSIYWLSRYKWGPIEWLWRSLTYGKWLPNNL